MPRILSLPDGGVHASRMAFIQNCRVMFLLVSRAMPVERIAKRSLAQVGLFRLSAPGKL
jgi:hypothetical protein